MPAAGNRFRAPGAARPCPGESCQKPFALLCPPRETDSVLPALRGPVRAKVARNLFPAAVSGFGRGLLPRQVNFGKRENALKKEGTGPSGASPVRENMIILIASSYEAGVKSEKAILIPLNDPLVHEVALGLVH